jgi:hypothetical protein
LNSLELYTPKYFILRDRNAQLPLKLTDSAF